MKEVARFAASYLYLELNQSYAGTYSAHMRKTVVKTGVNLHTTLSDYTGNGHIALLNTLKLKD